MTTLPHQGLGARTRRARAPSSHPPHPVSKIAAPWKLWLSKNIGHGGIQKHAAHFFVDHYVSLGVNKIYIFDHNSSAPVIKQLWDYTEAGIVKFHYIEDFILFNGDAIVQFEAYRQCIKKFAHRHQFLAFFEDDEYLVLKQAANTTSLPIFLRAYEGFGGLPCNWRIISSSGHTSRPTGRVVDNYVHCLPQQHFQNTHVKVIANTKYVIATHGNPHTFAYVGERAP